WADAGALGGHTAAWAHSDRAVSVRRRAARPFRSKREPAGYRARARLRIADLHALRRDRSHDGRTRADGLLRGCDWRQQLRSGPWRPGRAGSIPLHAVSAVRPHADALRQRAGNAANRQIRSSGGAPERWLRQRHVYDHAVGVRTDVFLDAERPVSSDGQNPETRSCSTRRGNTARRERWSPPSKPSTGVTGRRESLALISA